MKIFDLHCDTLMLGMLDKNHSLRSNKGQISLDKMRLGNVNTQCFAIYVPTHDEAAEYNLKLSPYEYYKNAVALFKKEMASNSDMVSTALNSADIRRNLDDGLLNAVLTIEDSIPLEGKAERLQEFYYDGVRMICLTWNYVNHVGHPHSSDHEKHKLGLTEFGRECVSIMNELGMIVDVSHLSEGGFFDVAEQSKKPFAASHSCARAICDHSRNLNDKQLHILADMGGVIGLSLVPSFLRSGSHHGTAEDVLQHALHIKNAAGIESLALGSDFDGFSDKNYIYDCTQYTSLIELFSRHFSTSELEKICFENAMRVFKDVCG